MKSYKIVTKKVEQISSSEKNIIDSWMEKEFGKKYLRNYKNGFENNSKIFLIKEKKEILAFGILEPLIMKQKNIEYKILGIGDIITIKRNFGYGKILVCKMLNYAKKKNVLGFCARKNLPFYKKCGMKTKKNSMEKFRCVNKQTGKLSKKKNGDLIFYEPKEKLISKMLKNKEDIIINKELW